MKKGREESTLFNKIWAVLLMIFGTLSLYLEHDLSWFLFCMIVAVCLFFCDDNMIGS